jgi:iron complex outermembrane receptor protein
MSGYVRRAESFRFPKADELTTITQGVQELRTQRGVAYEGGVIEEYDTYSADVGIYQLKLKDEIAFDPTQTPQNPFGSNRNLDPTIRRGATLSLKKQMTEKVIVDAQYNYVNARFQQGINAHHRIPLVSEHILRSGINYRVTARLNVYPEIIFTGNQFAANDDANRAGALGGYTIYNINLRYEYKELSASFRINNLFNKYYYFYTVFMPSTQTGFFYPAPGRNVTLTVNIAFA